MKIFIEHTNTGGGLWIDSEQPNIPPYEPKTGQPFYGVNGSNSFQKLCQLLSAAEHLDETDDTFAQKLARDITLALESLKSETVWQKESCPVEIVVHLNLMKALDLQKGRMSTVEWAARFP
jgi:hypothetical protein